MFWMAACKIGVVSALINYNLRKRSLRHCLRICGAKCVLAEASLDFAIEELLGAEGRLDLSWESRSDPDVPVYSILGRGCGRFPSIDEDVARQSAGPVDPRHIKGILRTDKCYLIYTSGTTGLPKAGVITHMRGFGAASVFSEMFKVRHDDVIYTTLPLYHSAGGMAGFGMCIYTGATLCVRSKFSAKNFVRDCKRTGATVTQYIGELCRYLLATPASPADRDHKLRIAIGNGLRPEIWNTFVRRFGLKEIGEFYGATEGNVAFFNHHYAGDNKSVGCIGRQGAIMRRVLGWSIVKFDVQEEMPVRDKVTGRCIETAPGQAGELLGKITAMPGRGFHGYLGNKKATQKKILTDVFSSGDSYFRTGDLISCDAEGYLRFVDRIGDTFRWKSENVSTTEVAEVISSIPGVEEVNVYGVAVPGTDGRACMAALVAKDEDGASALDLDLLLKTAKAELPSYAVPLFLRMLPEMEVSPVPALVALITSPLGRRPRLVPSRLVPSRRVISSHWPQFACLTRPSIPKVTSTFKHRKVELRAQGIDLGKVGNDKLLWLNPKTKRYEPFGEEESRTLTEGKARL